MAIRKHDICVTEARKLYRDARLTRVWGKSRDLWSGSRDQRRKNLVVHRLVDFKSQCQDFQTLPASRTNTQGHGGDKSGFRVEGFELYLHCLIFLCNAFFCLSVCSSYIYFYYYFSYPCIFLIFIRVYFLFASRKPCQTSTTVINSFGQGQSR